MIQMFRDIERWHHERELNDVNAQMVKVMEETGELASAIAHGQLDIYDCADAIGDSIIALIGVASALGIDSFRCLNQAWCEVKDRVGKTINGHFIKDGDE